MKSLASNQIAVSEAADLLEVHPSRVRALIAQGQLEAQKLGGRWLVDRRSVEARRSRPSPDGRPFSEANAWAILCLSEGGKPDWISRWELSRLRRRLREDGLDNLAARLGKRAVKKEFRVHPSLLPKLRQDSRLIPSGVSAAAHHQIDIVEPNEFEAYLGDDELEAVVRDHFLEPSLNANVVLHVAPPHYIARCANDVMAPAVAALDLSEAADAKSRRAGRERLVALGAALREPKHDRHS